MSAHLGKIWWWAALALLAIFVVFTQLDRQSRYWPRTAVFVPNAFQSFSQRHQTAAAVTQGSSSHALREARMLVERRPLPGEHLALLAAAQARAGTPEQSFETLQLAANRGWRDRGTQITALEIAIETDNGTEAARRFAALAALDGNGEVVAGTAQRILTMPDANKELRRLLANDPRWKDRVVRISPLLSQLCSDIDSREGVSVSDVVQCD